MKNKVKKYSIFLILSLLFNFQSYGKVDEASVRFAKYIYRLTLNSDQVVYIYGGSHVTASKFPIHLDQCVKDIFVKVDHVYIEADQLEIRSFFTTHQNTVSMKVVSDYIHADILNFLADGMFGKTSQDGIARLKRLDSQTVLNILFSRIPGSAKLLGQPDFGLDTELIMAARFFNKKLEYIESPEDQLEFFRLTPPKVYASAITAVVGLLQNENTANLYLNQSVSLMNAAANGDEEGIVLGLKFDGLGDYYVNTITNRNESITEKIVSRLSENKDKSAFIALGAAHLAGEGSVVQLLKAKGYTATRLCQ